MTNQRLGGRVCVVTGGAQGIGHEVARAIAREGGRVVIADIGTALDGTGSDDSAAERAAETIRSEGGTCLASATDITDPARTDDLVALVASELGTVDVVVNVAGNLRRGSILDATDDDWESTLGVHLLGSRNLTRSVGRFWRSRAGTHRRVINFSSDAGLFGEPDYVTYATAKAAVIGLTLSAAATLAEVGATANVYVPQASTRMTRSIPLDELPDRDRWESGEFDAANVPPTLLYIASEESDWLNGQIVGGWGFEAHRYGLAARERSIFSPGPWDLDTLFRALPAAFRSDG